MQKKPTSKKGKLPVRIHKTLVENKKIFVLNKNGMTTYNASSLAQNTAIKLIKTIIKNK